MSNQHIQEEDIPQSSPNDFDEIFDLVEKFEEKAFQTKKKINALDRGGHQSSMIPQTLKICFQILTKLAVVRTQDIPEFRKLEHEISESMQTTAKSNKEFGKFKGEYFAVCE